MKCPGGASLRKAAEREEAEGGVPSPSSSTVNVMQKPIEALPSGMRCPHHPEPTLPSLHHENMASDSVGGPRLGKGAEGADGGLEKRLT